MGWGGGGVGEEAQDPRAHLELVEQQTLRPSCLLVSRTSTFNVPPPSPGDLLKCRFWSRWSGVGYENLHF